MIQDVVISEFFEEIERAKQPGYVSRYDDFDFEYTDGVRSKPARFDAAHPYPTEQPHINPRTPANSDGAAKNHFRRVPSADVQRATHTPPPTGGSFGAGIFPQ
jgi:hypothetical protein